MSWSFDVIAKDKAKLKSYSRESLLRYHAPDTRGHARMAKVADQIDQVIDLFEVQPGQTLRLVSSGHLDEVGGGNCSISLNTHGSPVLLE